MSQETTARRRRRIALAALTASLAVATAACSGASSDEESSTSVSDEELVSMSEPAKGEVDSLTWNLTAGEPDTLDPPNAATYGGGQVVMNLCDTLVRYDAEYNMSPGLADYEQVSPTELKYTINKEATFWDGTPVTAEDVAYSLQRGMDGSIISIFFSAVKSIEVTGDDEVTVLFNTPDQKFNTEMTNISGVIYQKKFAEEVGDDLGTAAGGLMCSGPFKLDEWRSGNSITMSRNDSYWDEERMPLAQRVKFTFVTDGTALVQALNAGEIDGAYEIPPSAIPALEESTTGRLYYGPSTQGVFLSVANPGGITADPDFMEGLQRILDREAIADAVYRGAAEPLYTYITKRTWPTEQTDVYEEAYQGFVEARSYDIEAAREAVEKSGYDGEELVIAYQAGDPTSNQVVQLIQQQAKEIGVNVELESLGALAYQQAGYDASKREGFDFTYGSSFNSVADPLEPAVFNFIPGSPYNYTNYDDPETAELLNQAIAEFDPDRRAEIVIEAQERWESANLLVPIVSTNTVTFLNDRLAGAVTSFAYWSTPNMAWVGSSS